MLLTIKYYHLKDKKNFVELFSIVRYFYSNGFHTFLFRIHFALHNIIMAYYDFLFVACFTCCTCSNLNPITLPETPEIESSTKTYANLNTVSFPKTNSTVSDKIDYEDLGSSYRPINNIQSDDEIQSEIESSVVGFAENLNIDESVKSNSINSNSIIEEKVSSKNEIDKLSKNKNFNASAVVEN